MLQPSTLSFLRDLRKNNRKEWFDANRKRYKTARKDFEDFLQKIIERLGKTDPAILALKPKDCMFRINRDIRFSKDKSPYKSNFGASINPGGKKSPLAGYYFHVEPGESFAGGGIWMPQPPELKKVRQEIDYCLGEFRKIIGSKRFKETYQELYQGEDVLLTKLPKGFEKDTPAADYLKYKSYIALHAFTNEELTSPGLVAKTVKTFETLQPLLRFLNRAIGD